MAGTNKGSEILSQEDGDFPKARHIFGLMGFLGFAVVYSMRVNLSIAIVTMVKQSAISHTNSADDQTCPRSPVSNITKPHQLEGEFDCTEATQGIVLGSFYYGYVLTQIPGGRIAEIYGGKIIYGYGVLTCSIFTIITPFAARWNLAAMVAVRFAAGLCEGVTYPSIHVMLSKWIPPLERSTFSAVVYCGSYIGIVISMPLAGWFCSLEFLGGWPLAFYVTGIFGLVWFVFWVWLVHERPNTHPNISSKELSYIERAVEQVQNKDDDDGIESNRTPWLSILTCIPLWAIVVTQFTWSWTFFTLLSELPSYMKQILHFDIQSNSVLSSLPPLTAWLNGILCCSVAEWMLRKKYITLLNSYRLWNSVGTIIPALGLIGVAYVGCSGVWVMFMLAGLGAFCGATYASYQMNHINLSPRYAGTMFGFTNTICCTPGFLAPYVLGLIIQGNNTLAQWRYVFYLAAGINFLGNLFYLKFVSIEQQSWPKNSVKPIQLQERIA